MIKTVDYSLCTYLFSNLKLDVLKIVPSQALLFSLLQLKGYHVYYTVTQARNAGVILDSLSFIDHIQLIPISLRSALTTVPPSLKKISVTVC